ncbi:MAG: hypothetical protein ACJA0Q_000881 [Saprospiraceae bacterium]|jgi:hypothetical protein
MSATKSTVQATINLQNGMFCHLTEDFFVVNNVQKPKFTNFSYDLSKTKNYKKFRIVLNILFTFVFITAAIWSQFYPLILLMFVSLWDLRQLKRYKLPINKTKIIPIIKISEIQLKRGKMGFNYMDVFIESEGVKSFIPLQLYDSESTLTHAKNVAEHTGKLSESPEVDKIKIEDFQIPLNETSSYSSKNQTLYYTQNHIYDKARTDSYQYLRGIAYFLMSMILISIAIKINTIASVHTNYVDYVVIALFLLALLIPYKYSRKALPNVIDFSEIISLQKGTKKTYLILKQKFGFNLKVHFKNQHLPEDFEQHLNLQSK